MPPRITVVIASACTSARADMLRRACSSVLAGSADVARVLVVANGPRCDASLLEWLSSQTAIQVVRLTTGSYPLARRVGAEMAGTEYIAFLDDDDEYLPGSIAVRIDALDRRPEAVALVTNGIRSDEGVDGRMFPPVAELSDDPVTRVMQHGWQAAMLTLRASNVDLKVLDTEVRQYEWTYTAICLAMSATIVVEDVPTFRYYFTPGSLSQSAGHVLAAPAFWDRAIGVLRGSRYESVARERQGKALHDAATALLSRGELASAWRLHLRGWARPRGWMRYGLTARLAIASLRRLFQSA